MKKELELYKNFIDGLVERKDSVIAKWIKCDGFPKTDDNKAKNEFIANLTSEQRSIGVYVRRGTYCWHSYCTCLY